nr:immunoglobulin light chain junction region [Macaca mulatta]
CQHYDTSPYSF